MLQQQGKFEAGQVLLPMEAPWLSDFESELLTFPVGRYDDQVDALVQLLEWFSHNRSNFDLSIGMPVSIPKEARERNPFALV